MASRKLVLPVLLGAFSSLAASYQTDNFVVEAPSLRVARQVAHAAEQQRKQLARRWLGKELPDWEEPCSIRVRVPGPLGGSTTAQFDGDRIESLSMDLGGPLDRVLKGCLPHEMTHAIFAHHFRRPLPRWADEGGAVLAEDDVSRRAHDRALPALFRKPGRALSLRDLFRLGDYPDDLGVLYGQGYSVTRFLVQSGTHKQFLAFVAQGMRGDWDKAVHAHYRYKNIEQLERAWLKWQKEQFPPRPGQTLGKAPSKSKTP